MGLNPVFEVRFEVKILSEKTAAGDFSGGSFLYLWSLKRPYPAKSAILEMLYSP